MTVEEVASARDALVAQGLQPSQRAILAHLGRGSKRDVAKYLHQLEGTTPPQEPEVVAGGDPEQMGYVARALIGWR